MKKRLMKLLRKMQRLNKFSNIKSYLSIALLSLIIGLCGGVVGAAFSHSFTAVTNLRTAHSWLVFLLPLGGLLTVKIYKLLKTEGLSTDSILKSLKGDRKVSPLLLPAVFLSSLLTHLFGGSAGREGAALQMGGAVSSLLSKKLNLDEDTSDIGTVCGMSAFFSALFGTPLGASVFAVEVVFLKKKSLIRLIPSLISGFTAYFLAHLLGAHPERFTLNLPKCDFSLLWKTGVIILVCSAVCVLFVFTLEKTKELFGNFFKNPYLRIAAGGILIILLTVIEGSGDYNGGGMNIVEKIFSHNTVKYEAFLLKIIFTAITVAAGFKGGEIVPTFFIGATSGGALALLLGVPAPFGAALGMAVLFSGATNCPVATILLCGEMFGFKGILYFAVASVIARLLTTKNRLYEA